MKSKLAKPTLTKQVKKKLAKRLKALRENDNLNYSDVFFNSKVHPSTIIRIEKEELNPSLAVLIRLAKCFHISVSDLLDGI